MAADDSRKIAIADLVLKVAACERSIEVRRQQVCIKKDFQAYVAFSRICRDGSRAISPTQVHKFLQESTLDCGLRDCQAFVDRFDLDADGCLSFTEFLEAILPKEHPELRAYVSQQECFPITRDEYLSYDTECKLAKLVFAEVNLFETVVVEKEALMRQHGLTAAKVVALVDETGSNNLNFSNLQTLFNVTGVLPYDAEIINFIRRLDINGDGLVSLDELADFLNEYRFVDRGQKKTAGKSRSIGRSQSPETLSEERLRRHSPNRRVVERADRNVKPVLQTSSRLTQDAEKTARTLDSRSTVGRVERSPLMSRQKERENADERPNVGTYPASTSRLNREREAPTQYQRVMNQSIDSINPNDKLPISHVTSLNLNPPREQYRKALESQIQAPKESPQRSRYTAEQRDGRDGEYRSRVGASSSKPTTYRQESATQPRGTPVKRITVGAPEAQDESIDRLKISRVSPSRESNAGFSRGEETRDYDPKASDRNFKTGREDADTSVLRFEPEVNIFKQGSDERGTTASNRQVSREAMSRPETSTSREVGRSRPVRYAEGDQGDTKSRLALSDLSVENKSSETLYKALKLIMNQERNLELARRELVAKSDFDISEVFARIDKRNRSWFTIEDFRVFLSDIGLRNIETRALIDLYSSYDINQSCLLNFEQLVAMLCPLDGKFASHLNKPDRKVAQE